MTAVVEPNAPAPVAPAGVRRQARAWARTTPGWLRLASVGLAVLIVVCSLLGVFVTASRQAATDRARTTTGGALIEAQAVATSLSDADRAAAGTFLTTDATDKAPLYKRYQDDLARATTNLAEVSRHEGTVSAAGPSLDRLTTEIPIYSGLIETARTNDRLGNPVGTAYLGEADNLMTTSLLPAANQLYELQRSQLAKAYGNATRWPLVVVAVLLFVALVIGLVVLQVRMSRRFRRTLNLPLLAATLLVLAATVWLVVALVVQGADIAQAKRDGSDPIGVLTQASILSQQLRADDELTLVTRDAVPTYQTDYAKLAPQLDTLVKSNQAQSGSHSSLHQAEALVADLGTLHKQLRADDATNGKLSDAIGLDSHSAPTDVPAVADRLDQVLGTGTTRTAGRFVDLASGARDDLAGLVIGLLVLGLIAVVLTLLGAQRRIEEYRR